MTLSDDESEETSRTFDQLGELVHKNAGKLVFCITIALITLCAAIKSSKLDNDINNWIERNEKIDNELQYITSTLGEGYGTTSQLLIQTPNTRDNSNILDVKSFMVHLEAMAIATHVSVDMFDVTWSLKDLCYVPSLPEIEGMPVGVLENIIPCAIKTPLDCFWEGAKLLGPDPPVSISPLGFKAKWTNLNPLTLVDTMQRARPETTFSFSSLVEWMARVGMSTGYQFKPCLDPTDPNCPHTAPNKLTRQAPDIGAQLTGGCYGVAAHEMHWREEEIIGGIKKNASEQIVHASALQSIIQLMGEREMYEYFRKHFKVDSIDNWSVEKSKLILDAWQTRFKEELDQFARNSVATPTYDIHAMTSTSILNSLNVSSLNTLVNAELCFALMTLFTCLAFPRFSNKEEDIDMEATKCDNESQKSSFSLADQIGIWSLALVSSAFIGLQFIASLGLSALFDLSINAATTQILPPLALFYGFNQLFIVGNSFSIRSQNVPPEELCARCLNDFGPGILIELFTYSTVLLAITIIPVPATRMFALQTISYMIISTLTTMILFPSILIVFLKHRRSTKNQDKPCFVQKVLLINRPSRIIICILALVCTNALTSYAPKVKYGLELKDIVDRNTEEYNALLMQENFFPIYNMFAITKGSFDYPSNQRLLFEFYDKISNVDGIIADRQGKPRFWLESFRSWLYELQQRFDLERNQSLIGNDGWKAEASDIAKLAYKLLAQTGKPENLIDKSQVETTRLVDSQGIINQKSFYYYLTAWVMNDPFSYSTSEASFKPEPRQWFDNPEDLRVEKARPLIYAQIPFLMKLNPQNKLETVLELRSISQKFEKLGLPNFPTGIPFIFWNQFSHLNILVATTVALSAISIFFIIGIISLSFRASAIVIVMALYTMISLYGFLGYYSIPFNNILGVLLILSFGINVSFFVHMSLTFLSTEGDVIKRTSDSSHLKGLVLLMIVALSFFTSHFDFIVRFAQMISYLIVLNAINCLAVLPVVLSVSGIKPQNNLFMNKPKSKDDLHEPCATIETKVKHQHRITRVYPKLKPGISLSTISEESHSGPHDLMFDLSIKCYK